MGEIISDYGNLLFIAAVFSGVAFKSAQVRSNKIRHNAPRCPKFYSSFRSILYMREMKRLVRLTIWFSIVFFGKMEHFPAKWNENGTLWLKNGMERKSMIKYLFSINYFPKKEQKRNEMERLERFLSGSPVGASK